MAAGSLKNLKAFLTGGGIEIKSAVVTGALANANIAITGLKAGAQLLAVVNLTGDADEIANTSVTSAGNIQTTVDSSAMKLLVLYAQRA